jgi:bleomycin hydrolase
MRKLIFLSAALCLSYAAVTAQQNPVMTLLKENPATPVKDQGRTNTCWSFSTTSLLESENMRRGLGDFNLSEMFTVRKMYVEKAKNYLLRQGHAQFGPGGLGHDVIRCMAEYGAMPAEAYSGLVQGETSYDQYAMFSALKSYLDSELLRRPLPADWLKGYRSILDRYMGRPPATFTYRGKTYTPLSFAREVMHFDPDDYAGLTSFTHHPFGASFVIEIPDNYANGYYYNLPIAQLIGVVESAVKKGYTVMWDTDISNSGWAADSGYALAVDSVPGGRPVNPDMQQQAWNQDIRQKLFGELITEDDHLMQITGLARDAKGAEFFVVKNSWGKDRGPFGGYVYVSVPYFALNTITIVLPKAALDPALADKVSRSHPPFYQ